MIICLYPQYKCDLGSFEGEINIKTGKAIIDGYIDTKNIIENQKEVWDFPFLMLCGELDEVVNIQGLWSLYYFTYWEKST